MKSARILSSSLLQNSKAACSNGIIASTVTKSYSIDGKVQKESSKPFMTSALLKQDSVSICPFPLIYPILIKVFFIFKAN